MEEDKDREAKRGWCHGLIDNFIHYNNQSKIDYPNIDGLSNFLVIPCFLLIAGIHLFLLLYFVGKWSVISIIPTVVVVTAILHAAPIILMFSQYRSKVNNNRLEELKLKMAKLDIYLQNRCPRLTSFGRSLNQPPKKIFPQYIYEKLKKLVCVRDFLEVPYKTLNFMLQFIATSFLCATFIIATAATIMAAVWVSLESCINYFNFKIQNPVLLTLFVLLIFGRILHFILPYVISQNLSVHYPEYKLYKPSYGYGAILIFGLFISISFFAPDQSGSDIYEKTGRLIQDYRGRAFIYFTLLVSVERMLVNYKLVKQYNAKKALDRKHML